MTLELQAISKTFGERQVLNRLDLNVAKGECVALLGASGCGKSTALRLIAGLDPVSYTHLTLPTNREV